MRLGIWNNGAYAGYPDKPELQIKWFLDQAEAVKKQRIARGQSIDDPKQYGEWIADVERPAEQFRGRYQLRLDEAQSLLKQAPETPAASPEAAAAAPAGAPAQDAAAVAEAAPPPALATSAAPQALAAVKEAEKYLGTPYKWGGSTPQTGFDCSGLMQWAYAQAGIKIPRVTYTQIDAPNAIAGPPLRSCCPVTSCSSATAGQRPPRRHVARRRQVRARAAHRRRGEGLEPQRAATTRSSSPAGAASPRRWPALPPRRPRRLRRPSRRLPPLPQHLRHPPRRRSTRAPSPRPRRPPPATRPRRAATTAACS